MEQSYQKLQALLKMIFESEKRHYEAAAVVQVVELKRFLNYQSIARNKYANELVEIFTVNMIEPNMVFIDKGIQNRNDLDLKRVLENSQYIPIMRKCLAYDEDIIEACAMIIRDTSVPVDILEVITRLMTFLIFQGIEAGHIIEELKIRNRSRYQTKVVQLRNSYQ